MTNVLPGAQRPVAARRASHARVAAALWAAMSSVLAAGCEAPLLSRDGQLVIPQKGATRGAAVITANGVEFLDRDDIPQPVVRRSVDEPFRPATGFLLPPDGIWRRTSTPVPVSGPGLAVVLRASDALVPSWGGEILVRLDLLVPAAAFPDASASVRAPRALAIVLDGRAPNTAPLVETALEALGERDRAMILNAAPARVVLPLLPGSHRTLLGAATQRVIEGRTRSLGARGAAPSRAPGIRDLAAALSLARGLVAARAPFADAEVVRQVLVVTDGQGVASGGARLAREVRALAAAGIRLTAVAAPDSVSMAALAPLGGDVHAGGRFEDRQAAVEAAVPPPGDVVLDEVALSLSSAPAPLRLIELSGGASALGLDQDLVLLGELYAGEARTEVARVAVPPWVPGEPLDIEISARYRDAATGKWLSARSATRCRYSNDIERIARSRHGDVIAYASALAMVRRLHRAFAGSEVDRLGGLRPVVAWQARSLGKLSQVQRDPALAAQAEVLRTLLSAIED